MSADYDGWRHGVCVGFMALPIGQSALWCARCGLNQRDHRYDLGRPDCGSDDRPHLWTRVRVQLGDRCLRCGGLYGQVKVPAHHHAGIKR